MLANVPATHPQHLEAAHIISVADGGPSIEANEVAMCRTCNRAQGATSGIANIRERSDARMSYDRSVFESTDEWLRQYDCAGAEDGQW